MAWIVDCKITRSDQNDPSTCLQCLARSVEAKSFKDSSIDNGYKWLLFHFSSVQNATTFCELASHVVSTEIYNPIEIFSSYEYSFY